MVCVKERDVGFVDLLASAARFHAASSARPYQPGADVPCILPMLASLANNSGAAHGDTTPADRLNVGTAVDIRALNSVLPPTSARRRYLSHAVGPGVAQRHQQGGCSSSKVSLSLIQSWLLDVNGTASSRVSRCGLRDTEKLLSRWCIHGSSTASSSLNRSDGCGARAISRL